MDNYEREIYVDVCFRGEKANEKRKMREKSSVLC